jgi:hypothetical protein
MPLTRIQSLGITDGTIVNADINASAAIVSTKLSGTGKVLQVVQGTAVDYTSTSSTSFVETGLTVSITPSSASNKVLVICSGGSLFSPSGQTVFGTILKGSTNLGGTNGFGQATGNIWIGFSPSVLDSPNTTSSITYKGALRVSGGSDGRWGGDTGSASRIIAIEISA